MSWKYPSLATNRRWTLEPGQSGSEPVFLTTTLQRAAPTAGSVAVGRMNTRMQCGMCSCGITDGGAAKPQRSVCDGPQKKRGVLGDAVGRALGS